jgi:outer membrane lipoprotein SlyB
VDGPDAALREVDLHALVPPRNHATTGAIIGGAITGLALGGWALAACDTDKHSCAPIVIGATVIGALPGAVIGALIGGNMARE